MITIKKTSLINFVKECENKELYCFGCGKQSEQFFSQIKDFHLENNLIGFIDNDVEKAGKLKSVGSKGIPILHFSTFLKQKLHNSIVLISSSYFEEIIYQMDNEPILEQLPCYVDFLLVNGVSKQNFQMTWKDRNVIPRKIHYCWFGGNKMPERFQQYIETWKQHCPSYEIIRWDESNYDISKNLYMKQAYECKKWGFVPDYARADIIYHYGGIYLDTDVEVVKSLDDLLYDEMFCGFESSLQIAFGLGFGAKKGNKIIKEIMDFYNEKEFILKNGELDQTPSPVYQSAVMKKLGFELNGQYQKKGTTVVYPQEVLAPYDYFGINQVISPRTYTIHHYAATWCENDKVNDRKRIMDGIDSIRDRITED